jgi:hypothetical protein
MNTIQKIEEHAAVIMACGGPRNSDEMFVMKCWKQLHTKTHKRGRNVYTRVKKAKA